MQYRNLNSELRSRDLFKKGAILKNQMSSGARIRKTVLTLGEIAMITIVTIFIVNMANAQTATNSKPASEKSIKTVYPTKDWVISDFVVNDSKFGAKAKPGFDNRAAFQAAIDAAYINGGGVV